MTRRPLCRSAAILLSAAILTCAAPAAAQDRAADLPSPLEVSQRSARELTNLELQELALERDLADAQGDQAIAITLYVGGVLGAIASVSLTIGAILEGVCIDGDVSGCMDGPSFVAAAIPTAIITTTLLWGATIHQRRYDASSDALEDRRRDVEERRRRLSHDLGLALGPTSIVLRGTF